MSRLMVTANAGSGMRWIPNPSKMVRMTSMIAIAASAEQVSSARDRHSLMTSMIIVAEVRD
jgi:hypothetical protein